uniref:Odorant receptor, family 70, subfamily A, member 4 n=1 Tax=Acanthochromis polyacanthus TaxID=80966 RepID=A0A3Q1EBR8_9TELE
MIWLLFVVILCGNFACFCGDFQQFVGDFKAVCSVFSFFVVNLSLFMVISSILLRSLHEPMYLLFCNMSVNDVFGSSVVIPRLLADVFLPSSQRYIRYTNCAVQAFCTHFHGATSHTVLMIMAFDRYNAICRPLRYAAIMTRRTVVLLSTLAWMVSFVMILVMVSLSIRLSRCRRVVNHPFCDNPSLFKLSCENIFINHVYGLITAMGMMALSLCVVVLNYLRIAVVCLSRKNQVLNRRALQTCASHLAVYVILLLSGFIIIILHRFPQLSEERKLASILFHVVPPALNGVIYGLQIKAVREKILIIFNRK